MHCATFLNSNVSHEEREERLNAIHKGEKSILYIAPEMLLTTSLETLLGGRRLGLFVVDEAHTVTSWGRDFRADYWFMGDYLERQRKNGLHFPVLCLTATAVFGGRDDVVQDTISTLGLNQPSYIWAVSAAITSTLIFTRWTSRRMRAVMSLR